MGEYIQGKKNRLKLDPMSVKVTGNSPADLGAVGQALKHVNESLVALGEQYFC